MEEQKKKRPVELKLRIGSPAAAPDSSVGVKRNISNLEVPGSFTQSSSPPAKRLRPEEMDEKLSQSHDGSKKPMVSILYSKKQSFDANDLPVANGENVSVAVGPKLIKFNYVANSIETLLEHFSTRYEGFFKNSPNVTNSQEKVITTFGGSGVGQTSTLFGIPGKEKGIIHFLYPGVNSEDIKIKVREILPQKYEILDLVHMYETVGNTKGSLSYRRQQYEGKKIKEIQDGDINQLNNYLSNRAKLSTKDNTFSSRSAVVVSVYHPLLKLTMHLLDCPGQEKINTKTSQSPLKGQMNIETDLSAAVDPEVLALRSFVMKFSDFLQGIPSKRGPWNLILKQLPKARSEWSLLLMVKSPYNTINSQAIWPMMVAMNKTGDFLEGKSSSSEGQTPVKLDNPLLEKIKALEEDKERLTELIGEYLARCDDLSGQLTSAHQRIQELENQLLTTPLSTPSLVINPADKEDDEEDNKPKNSDDDNHQARGQLLEPSPNRDCHTPVCPNHLNVTFPPLTITTDAEVTERMRALTAYIGPNGDGRGIKLFDEPKIWETKDVVAIYKFPEGVENFILSIPWESAALPELVPRKSGVGFHRMFQCQNCSEPLQGHQVAKWIYPANLIKYHVIADYGGYVCCPLCNRSYQSMQGLQAHYPKCLDGIAVVP